MTFSIPKLNIGSHNICSKSNKTIGLTPCPISEGKHGQGIDPGRLIHLRTMVRASDPVP